MLKILFIPGFGSYLHPPQSADMASFIQAAATALQPYARPLLIGGAAIALAAKIFPLTNPRHSCESFIDAKELATPLNDEIFPQVRSTHKKCPLKRNL